MVNAPQLKKPDTTTLPSAREKRRVNHRFACSLMQALGGVEFITSISQLE